MDYELLTDLSPFVNFICYQQCSHNMVLELNENIILKLIETNKQKRILNKFIEYITHHLSDAKLNNLENIQTNLDSAIKHEIKNISILKDILSKEHESVLFFMILMNKLIKERILIIGYKNPTFAYEFVKQSPDNIIYSKLKINYNAKIIERNNVVNQFNSSIIILDIILKKIVPTLEIINPTLKIMNISNNYKMPNDINYHKYILEGIIAIFNDLTNDPKNINILIESFNYMINIQNRIGSFLHKMIHNLCDIYDTYDTYSELNIFTEEKIKVRVKTPMIYILIMNEILYDNLVCLEDFFFK
jgi:hypothetical protein